MKHLSLFICCLFSCLFSLSGCDKINGLILPSEGTLSSQEANSNFSKVEQAHLAVANTITPGTVSDPVVNEMLQKLKTCTVSKQTTKEGFVVALEGTCPVLYRETHTLTSPKRFSYSYRVSDKTFLRIDPVQNIFLRADFSDDTKSWDARIDYSLDTDSISNIAFAKTWQILEHPDHYKVDQSISITTRHGQMSGTSTYDGYIVGGVEKPNEPTCKINKLPQNCSDLKATFNDSLGFDLSKEITR